MRPCTRPVSLARECVLSPVWRPELRSYYVHLKRPSTLQRDTNLYIFRTGCTPMWEVRRCRGQRLPSRPPCAVRLMFAAWPQAFPDGGCWILKVRKHTGVLSKMWQDLVLGALGECFEEPGVVGVALAIRSKEDMLSVWHSNNANDNVRFFIG